MNARNQQETFHLMEALATFYQLPIGDDRKFMVQACVSLMPLIHPVRIKRIDAFGQSFHVSRWRTHF
jgi:hypothetical protein